MTTEVSVLLPQRRQWMIIPALILAEPVASFDSGMVYESKTTKPVFRGQGVNNPES